MGLFGRKFQDVLRLFGRDLLAHDLPREHLTHFQGDQCATPDLKVPLMPEYRAVCPTYFDTDDIRVRQRASVGVPEILSNSHLGSIAE